MKFNCNLTSFAKEISKASSFALTKNSLSMTSCILIEAKAPGPIITIKATDGKMGFVSGIPVDIRETGSVAVFADKINAVLKNLPEGDISISTEDGKMTITPADKKNIKVNIKCLDSTKFPEISGVPSDCTTFTIKTTEFTDMADSVSFSVGEDTSRNFLTGVCLEEKDGKFTMVATDGRRLAMNRIDGFGTEFSTVIVPVRFFNALKNIDDEKISVSIGNGTIFASTASTVIMSSLIAGVYPNYERVIPADATNEIKVTSSVLEKAVNLISIMSDSKTKRIFLECTREGLIVSGEDSNYGDSNQLIPCVYEGEDVKTSFNSLLISPCLKKIPTVDVVLRFPKSQRAWVINPTGDESIIYVLAPMQV